MASVEQCEQALHELASKLGGVDAATREKVVLDRSLVCRITDPPVTFTGRLRQGGLHDIAQAGDDASGQIGLRLSGDDLLALTAGTLGFAPAWATGRLKIDASVLDLLKLRALF